MAHAPCPRASGWVGLLTSAPRLAMGGAGAVRPPRPGAGSPRVAIGSGGTPAGVRQTIGGPGTTATPTPATPTASAAGRLGFGRWGLEAGHLAPVPLGGARRSPGPEARPHTVGRWLRIVGALPLRRTRRLGAGYAGVFWTRRADRRASGVEYRLRSVLSVGVFHVLVRRGTLPVAVRFQVVAAALRRLGGVLVQIAVGEVQAEVN